VSVDFVPGFIYFKISIVKALDVQKCTLYWEQTFKWHRIENGLLKRK
jgi:hypothetical protein